MEIEASNWWTREVPIGEIGVGETFSVDGRIGMVEDRGSLFTLIRWMEGVTTPGRLPNEQIVKAENYVLARPKAIRDEIERIKACP